MKLPTLRRVLRLLVLPTGAALLIAGLHGCGLETVLVLNPPGAGPTSGIDLTFQVYLTGANDEQEFRGVEIFYKIYPPTTPIGSLQEGLSTYSELVNNGFRRLYSVSDRRTNYSRPIIPVGPGERGDSTITIDFSPLMAAPTPGEPVIDSSGALTLSGMQFRRGVWDTDDTFKSFADDYLSTDPDISGITSGGVRLVLYAISYGKQDLSTDAYSRAVPLTHVDVPSITVN